MKAKLIALATLSTLALSPVFGAPRKATTAESKKNASSPSASATAAKAKSSPAQATAREQAADLTTTQRAKILALLNEGTASELSAIKGVSETRAAAIKKARPFQAIDDVILVSGIGPKTVSEIVTHAHGLTATKSRKSSQISSSKTKASPSASSSKRTKSASASSKKKKQPAPPASSPKDEMEIEMDES